MEKKKSPAQRRKTNAKSKNVSLKEVAGKVIDLAKKTFSRKKTDEEPVQAPPAKKPFGGKGGRKRKPTTAEIEKQNAAERLARLEKEADSPPVEEATASSVFGSFFYTNDAFINQFEDKEILSDIQRKYPDFNPVRAEEHDLRKAVLGMLGDSRFMSGLMDRYNMNIFDFFKFLFRIEPSIFKGAFIQKIQKTIKRKKYAAAKKHCYRFQKQNKRSRRKKS